MEEWFVSHADEFLLAVQQNKLHPVYFFIVFIINVILYMVITLIEHFSKKKKEDRNFLLSFKKQLIGFMTCNGVSILTVLILKNNGIYIGPIIGYLLGELIQIKFFNKKQEDDSSSKKEEKNESKKESESPSSISNTNTNNININIDLEDDEDDDVDLGYFNPNNIKIPDGMNINNLDLTTILEIYGYIAPNHKYKMISSSIFETPDEQIKNLLAMYVLDENELKEAKVILNLIRLKHRLVTKEEALKYIMEAERRKEVSKNNEANKNKRN